MNNTMNKAMQMKLHIIITEVFPILSQFKEENDQQSFNRTMEVLLPNLSNYIATWLNRAVKNKEIPAGKYKVEDFVDELYILTYDHFHEVGTSKDLHGWLFKKTIELLEDTEIEEEFDDFFFKNIDNYTKDEWAEMEEKYSTDGDGDLIMEEELDDSSYAKNDYVLADVFIEDGEKQIIENLNKKLEEKKIHRHFKLILHQLPLVERTVFDLAVIHEFQLEDIAKIKQISVKQVESYLLSARNSIRISFKTRYSF